MKSMYTLRLAGLVAAFVCLSPMYEIPASAAENNPCSEDIAKFCRDSPPTKAAIAHCLEYQEKELSAACREYRSKTTGRREEIREEMTARVRFRQACKGDMATFCKDVKPELPIIIECLSAHESALTGPCAEEIRERRTPPKGTGDKKKGE